MGTDHVLPRRLSADGCKTAGTQLSAVIDALKKEGASLDKELLAEGRQVAEATEAVKRVQTAGDMPAIDRATDQAVAALDDALEGKQNGFGAPELLPLTEEERAEAELATRVRRELLPDGTSFVQLPYRQQWAKLEALGRGVEARRVELKKLGLDAQASRLLRWVALYGAKLGVTRAATPSDAEAQAVDAWHVAFESFVDVVRYHHRGPAGAAIRARLLAPYEDQSAAERQVEKSKRKPKTPA